MKNSNDEARSAARKPVVDPCTTRSAIKVSTPWAEFEQAGPVQLEAEPRDEVQALRPNKLAAWRTVDDPMTGAAARRAGLDPRAARVERKTPFARVNAAYRA